MPLILTICRLLAACAVLGLLLAPLAQPAMAIPSNDAGPMAAAEMQTEMSVEGAMAMPDGMPCCPEQPSMPDCSKHCLMMMCAASAFLTLPRAGWSLQLVAESGAVIAGEDAALSGISVGPPPKPPRA